MKSMKYLPVLLISLALAGCARRNFEVISHDGKPILLGKINREGLEKAPYAGWFNPAYQKYNVDKTSLSNVNLKGVEIKLFIGTWCSDSQREVPRFYKLLDQLGYSSKKVEMVGLDNHPDRRKTSPDGSEKGWKIEYVPTFIFLKDGKEIGRIIESPMASLEKDLAGILLKK
jgi:thiol-disulfide isomerase/thioredoxin